MEEELMLPVEIPESLTAMGGVPSPVDVELVKKAATGDHAAFTKLFYQTYRYAFVLVAAQLSSDEDTRDALQEVYTRVYTGLPRLREPEAFLGWLKVIAQNCVLSQHRKNALDPLSAAVYMGDEEDLFLAEEERRETALDIRAVLGELPEEQARLLVLVYYDGMKLSEIARMQGLPASTVRSRFAAAKRALISALKGRGIDRAVYGRGELISAMATSIRDAIGTDMLSAATAQEILDEVLRTPEPMPMGHVVAKLTKRRRDAAVLRIAALVVALSLAASAVMVALMNGRDRLPVAQPVSTTTVTPATTISTTAGDGMTTLAVETVGTTSTSVVATAETTAATAETSSTTAASTTLPASGTTSTTTAKGVTTTASTTKRTTTTTTVQPVFQPDYRAGHANTKGNRTDNLHHNGIVAAQDGWIYFTSADYKNIYKAKADGSEKQRVFQYTSVRHINVVGDWIYFGGSGLHRVRTDGTGYESFLDKTLDWLFVSGDTAYYVVSGAWLYEMSLVDRTTRCLARYTPEWVLDAGDHLVWKRNDKLYIYNTKTRTVAEREEVVGAGAYYPYSETAVLMQLNERRTLDSTGEEFFFTALYTLDVTDTQSEPKRIDDTEYVDNMIWRVTDHYVLDWFYFIWERGTGAAKGQLPVAGHEDVTDCAVFGDVVYWYSYEWILYRTDLATGKTVEIAR